MTNETTTLSEVQPEKAPETLKTEIGELVKNGDWWNATFDIKIGEDPHAPSIFGHDRIPGVSYDAGDGVQYVSDRKSLLIGLLLSKGYQLRFTFANPGGNILKHSDRYTTSMDEDAFFYLRNGDIKQAWAGVVQWNDKYQNYVMPVKQITRIEAYLSPLYLDKDSAPHQRLEDSVSFLDIMFTEDTFHIDFKTRVLHSVYALSNTDRTWYGAYKTRENGLARVQHMRFLPNGNAWFTNTHSDVIEVLYFQGLVAGRTRDLYSNRQLKRSSTENILTVGVHGIEIYPAKDWVSVCLRQMERKFPKSWKDALPAIKKESE